LTTKHYKKYEKFLTLSCFDDKFKVPFIMVTEKINNDACNELLGRRY